MIDIIIRVGTARFPNFQIVMSESSETDTKGSLQSRKKKLGKFQTMVGPTKKFETIYLLLSCFFFSTLTTSFIVGKIFVCTILWNLLLVGTICQLKHLPFKKKLG